jgi:hypothetical protein
MRGQDEVGRALQVGAGYRPASVPDARRRRRQWCTNRQQERQLQARPIYQGDGCHPPVATRGYAYAPQVQQGRRVTIETKRAQRQVRNIDMARKDKPTDQTQMLIENQGSNPGPRQEALGGGFVSTDWPLRNRVRVYGFGKTFH